MTITVHLFGAEVFSLTIGADVAGEDDPAAVLSGGSTGGQYVGFAEHRASEEHMPQRTPAWDEPEERRG